MKYRLLNAALVSVAASLAALSASPLRAQTCPLEGNDSTNKAASLIQEAREFDDAAAQLKRYEGALEALRAALAMDARDPAALWLLGEAYIGLGNYAAADSALDRLVEAAPGCDGRAEQTRRSGWVTMYNRGIRAFNAGDMDGALEAFETANLIDEDSRSYNNAAYIYEQRGDVESAIATYRKSAEVASEPEAARAATINLAELITAQGRGEEALGIYADYTAGHPDDALARINYAVLLSQAGRPDSSRAIFSDLLAKEDQSFEEWNQLGVGLMRAYAYREAIPALEKARALKPYHKDAMANLVDALIESEQHDRAYPLADTLVNWFPYDAQSYTRLAQCLTSLDRAGESLIFLQLQQALPMEFEGLHMVERDGHYVVRGQVVGRGSEAVGQTKSVRFEFLSPAGEVIAAKRIEFAGPPAGGKAPIRVEVDSEDAVSGFRYSKAQL